MDKKYTQIINCPACRGTGETYIMEMWQKGLETRYGDGSVDYEEDKWFKFLSDEEQYHEYVNAVRDTGRYDLYGENKQVDIKYTTCPFCKGDGAVYAWFEKKTSHTEICTSCMGTGKMTAKVKVEIGTETKQITCNACSGNGKLTIATKGIVHVKTKAGRRYDEEDREYESLRNAGNLEYADKPFRFQVVLTDENYSFYSKSKSRTL